MQEMTKKECKPYNRAIMELCITARSGVRGPNFYNAVFKVKDGMTKPLPDEWKNKAISLINAFQDMGLIYPVDNKRHNRTFDESNSVWEFNRNLGRGDK